MLRYSAGGYAGRWKDASLPYGTVTKSGARLTKTAYKSANGYVEVLSESGCIERRKFTIDELKLISGFPSDFRLSGSFDEQWERLGNAVPPVMMFHVADAIYKNILAPLARSRRGESHESQSHQTEGREEKSRAALA
jgi:hypothetical protein